MGFRTSGDREPLMDNKEKDKNTRTYIFQVRFEKEKNGYWRAEIPPLPGCKVWALSKESALEGVEIKAKEYLLALLQDHDVVDSGEGVAVLQYAAIRVTV
jgi:predicted RNase H-like HicB family nuclease